MVVVNGWTLTTEGIHYFARKGAMERKFSTRGDRANFVDPR